MKPVTKSSVEVVDAQNIPEVIANAFRLATAPQSGACFISLPQDILSEKTEINKAEKTSKENLKTGQQVAVFGTENSDGSVTAQNIQLNPQFRQMIDRPTPQLTK